MRTRILVVSALCALFVSPALLPDTADAVPRSVLRMKVVGLRSDAGTVRCLAFARDDGFPQNRDGAQGRAISPIRGKSATCEFPGLPPGRYALSFFHDEDDDDEFDTNFLGLPTEGYGFGNDARGTMGPPDYSKALMAYGGGRQTVTLKAAY